jgi:hypothetical protein
MGEPPRAACDCWGARACARRAQPRLAGPAPDTAAGPGAR